MTVPENFMTYYGSIDRLRYRVHARNVGLRSKTSSNTRAIASTIKIRGAFHRMSAVLRSIHRASYTFYLRKCLRQRLKSHR